MVQVDQNWYLRLQEGQKDKIGSKKVKKGQKVLKGLKMVKSALKGIDYG